MNGRHLLQGRPVKGRQFKTKHNDNLPLVPREHIVYGQRGRLRKKK